MAVVKWKVFIATRVTNATVIAFSAEEYQDEEDFAPLTFGSLYVSRNVCFLIVHDPFLHLICRALCRALQR